MSTTCDRILTLLDEALAATEDRPAVRRPLLEAADIIDNARPAHEDRPAFTVHTGPSLSNTVRLIISEHAEQYHLDDPVRRLVAKIIHAVEDAER